jgi:hypothetical protein
LTNEIPPERKSATMFWSMLVSVIKTESDYNDWRKNFYVRRFIIRYFAKKASR